EIRRIGSARQINITSGVGGNGPADILAASAEIGGIAEDRIDDQRPLLIVGGHFEPDAVFSLRRIAARDRPLFTVMLLIKNRLAEKEPAAGNPNDQRPVRINL